MNTFHAVVARSNSFLLKRETSLSPAMLNLIIALMVLIFVGLCLVGSLYLVRKIRKTRAIQRQQLPQYEETQSNPRRLTISATPYGGRASSVYVYDEKSSMIKNSSSPPLSPDSVPEIRITFPDEQDESGRRTSGRVVIVRVGERGNVGLEPVRDDEQLPAYEKQSGEKFHSIDMDRIGGLKEKSSWS
jgi:hypothetical protein